MARWDRVGLEQYFSVRWKSSFWLVSENKFFFDTKVVTAHFPENRFVSNIEIALGNTLRLETVQVSFNSVGYSKSYRWPKVLKNLRSLEKVAQTLVCSSRMNFRIEYTSNSLFFVWTVWMSVSEYQGCLHIKGWSMWGKIVRSQTSSENRRKYVEFASEIMLSWSGRPCRELSWTGGSRKTFKWLVETE